jgi:hypothetical protein
MSQYLEIEKYNACLLKCFRTQFTISIRRQRTASINTDSQMVSDSMKL